MDDIFIDCFSSLQDPRLERTKKHLLPDIIAISLCGILSGSETWEEIEDFANENEKWFKTFLSLPNGIPSHDTISRVFSVLDSQEFQSCCLAWLRRIQELLPETVIPIDGKTLKGSRRVSACQKALHIVNAWSCENGVCLGQLNIDEKSNEITAVPELLKLLYIKGAIVTLDAMGAQKETVKMITDMDADYVISLKGNQGNLHEIAVDTFNLSAEGSDLNIELAHDEVEGSHGKIEERKVEVISADYLEDQVIKEWKNLNSIARITYTRTENNNVFTEYRYYISSLNPKDPKKILNAIRMHWQVENCLHWCLDIIFKEDNCRIRDKNAASNMSWLRKFCLGLLKNDTSFKASIRRKQRKACTNIEYMAKVIGQI